MGALSDKFGRKPFMLASMFGMIVAMTTVAVWQSLPAYIAATVVRGLTDDASVIAYAFVGALCFALLALRG